MRIEDSQPGAPSDCADVDPQLLARLRSFATASSLLIALDFDGVLAPLQDDPATSEPLPQSVRAVTTLAACPDTFVAYISGRPLDDLRALSRAPGQALFVGSHGAEEDFSSLDAERRSADEANSSEGTAQRTDEQALAVLDDAYGQLRDEVSGVWMEEKPLGRAFHTRDADAAATAHVNRRLDAVASRLQDTRVVRGKDVYEFTTRHDTKGDGLERILARTGAHAAIYIGDDVTDEDAFEVLAERPDSLGIKVGAGATAAGARIAGPQDVAALLSCLAQAREASTHR